jgi:PAS domain S-box-containing protein
MNRSAVHPRAPAPPVPWTEEERLASLRSYRILDTPPEPAFDEIARIAALICKAPIAVVNLIESERQFFKAEIGLGVRETPRDVSFCAQAILQRELFVVPDTTKDPRFSSNPLVTGAPHLRFYAGALLETPEGLPIGTVCVLDHEPRPEGITQEQGEMLRALARAAMTQIELRRSSDALAASEKINRTITENAAEALFMMDAGGRVTFMNPAAERLFGWSAEELHGQVLHDAVHDHHVDGSPYPAHQCPLVRALSTGEVMRDHEDVFFRKDGSAVPVICSNAPIRNGETIVGAVIAAHDISDRKRAEERQHLLVRELHHRVKNTLATVQAIAGSTMRSAGSMEEFRDSFAQRLMSLGKTHTLLTENAWGGALLEDLLRLELDPYDDDTGARVKLAGPSTQLPAELSVPLGMAFHELTTNAVKYGALSVFGGQVEVAWTVQAGAAERRLRLTWQERNGPAVQQPERRGFGSQLLQRVLGTQLNGEVRIDYAPEGVRVLIEAALPNAGTEHGETPRSLPPGRLAPASQDRSR